MNYTSWAGYGFYAALTKTQMASLFASWGLLTAAPGAVEPVFWTRVTDWFWEFFN